MKIKNKIKKFLRMKIPKYDHAPKSWRYLQDGKTKVFNEDDIP